MMLHGIVAMSFLIPVVWGQAIEADASCDARLYLDQALVEFTASSTGFVLQVEV